MGEEKSKFKERLAEKLEEQKEEKEEHREIPETNTESDLKGKLIAEVKEEKRKAEDFDLKIKTTAENLKKKLCLEKISVITVEDGGQKHVCYLKPLSRMAFAQLSMDGGSSDKYAQIILDLLAIKEHSDKAFWENDSVFLSGMSSIIEATALKKSSLAIY